MPLRDRIPQHLLDQLELAGIVGIRSIIKNGMAADLTQPQQSLQKLHARTLHARPLECLFDSAVKKLSGYIVKHALTGDHVAVNHHLVFRWKLFHHLIFRAPQDKRKYHFPQHPECRFIHFTLDRKNEMFLKCSERTEHPRIQKRKQRPELRKVVLDRRPAEREAMVAVKRPDCFADPGDGVFNYLCFIEDYIMEMPFPQHLDVADNRPVSGQYRIGHT